MKTPKAKPARNEEAPSEAHTADVAAAREAEDASVTAWAQKEREIYDLKKAVESELLAILDRLGPLDVRANIWDSNVSGDSQAGVNARPI